MKFHRLLLPLVFALPFVCTAEGINVKLQGYRPGTKMHMATTVTSGDPVPDGEPVTVEIEHAKLSVTIKNLLDDYPKIEDPVGMFKIETILLHSLNKQQIEFVFSYIKKIFAIAKTDKAQVVLNINETKIIEGKKTIPQELAEQLKKDNLPIPLLTDLLFVTNYLEVNILLPAIVEFLKDFITQPENLKKFRDKDSDFLALIDAIEKIDLKYQKELTEYFLLKHADMFVKTLIGHANGVSSVAFNHDGTLLASGSEDKIVRLWDPKTVNLIKTLNGHTDPVLSVAFNHDGTILASASRDKTIKIWDPETGNLIKTLNGHTKTVISVAFNHNGTLLASGSEDKTIKLWDPKTGNLIKTLSANTDPVLSVAFNHDGTILASASLNNKTIKLWNPKTGNLIKTLSAHTKTVISVAFNHNGTLLASGSEDKTIKLWDPKTGNLIKTLSDHTDPVLSVAFNHNGTLLASASLNKTIKLWDPKTGSLIKTLSAHNDHVYSVAFNHDDTLLASGSEDKTIKIWSFKHSITEILEQLVPAPTLLERARDAAAGLRKYLGY